MRKTGQEGITRKPVSRTASGHPVLDYLPSQDEKDEPKWEWWRRGYKSWDDFKREQKNLQKNAGATPRYEGLILALKDVLASSGVNPSQATVMSSGAMAAHGLRDVHDLDVHLTPKAFQSVATHPLAVRSTSRLGSPLLTLKTKLGTIECVTGPFAVNGQTFSGQEPTEEHGGLPHWTLPTTARFKKAMNRDKDRLDLSLMGVKVPMKPGIAKKAGLTYVRLEMPSGEELRRHHFQVGRERLIGHAKNIGLLRRMTSAKARKEHKMIMTAAKAFKELESKPDPKLERDLMANALQESKEAYRAGLWPKLGQTFFSSFMDEFDKIAQTAQVPQTAWEPEIGAEKANIPTGKEILAKKKEARPTMMA